LDKIKSDNLRRLPASDLKHLVECIEHAYTRPHYDLAELVPILVDGHHRIDDLSAKRIKAAIERFTEDDLTWVVDHAGALLPG
jgi:hypothetical protein